MRVYPVRNDQLDDQIHSFPLTIISHRLGELFWLMPDDASQTGWDHPAAYDKEVETPYYYSATFDDSLIQTEFTPTARCGFYRFTFPSGKPVILLANRQPGELKDEGGSCVSGRESFNGMEAYFYGEFNAPVQVQTKGSGDHGRLAITAATGGKVLEFRYGISYISVEQARTNLREEIPG